MLDGTVRSCIATLAISCALHAGVITGVLLGEHWLLSSVAAKPAVATIDLIVVPPPPEPPAPTPEPPRPKPAAPAPPRPVRPPKLVEKPLPEVAQAAPPRPAPALEPPATPEPPPIPAPPKPEPPPKVETAAKPEPPAPAVVAPAPPPAVSASPPAEAAPAARPGVAGVPGPPAATEPAAKSPDGLAVGRSGPRAPSSGPPGSGPPGSGPPGSGPAVAAVPSRPGATGAITQYARPEGGYQVRPTYPSSARRLGIQGTAILKVQVLADGRVGEVVVQQTAGHPDLDQAATEAVKRWRFEPGRRGDEPVAMWVLLPVEFRLR